MIPSLLMRKFLRRQPEDPLCPSVFCLSQALIGSLLQRRYLLLKMTKSSEKRRRDLTSHYSFWWVWVEIWPIPGTTWLLAEARLRIFILSAWSKYTPGIVSLAPIKYLNSQSILDLASRILDLEEGVKGTRKGSRKSLWSGLRFCRTWVSIMHPSPHTPVSLCWYYTGI